MVININIPEKYKGVNYNIDYGSLYGVKPGESDFSSVIKRNHNIKHFDGNKINDYINWLCLQRKKNKKNI